MATYQMPLNGKWVKFSDKMLIAANESGDKARVEQAEAMWELYQQYDVNRISFFLAHSGGTDFINDYDKELCILLAGEQQGKTFAGLAWYILRAIPCDPNWPCFTKHGLTCPDWDGPYTTALASYEMVLHCQRNLWPKLADLLPAYELKEYSPHWHPKDSRKQQKQPNWAAPIIRLDCGSRMDFFAYRQHPEAFVSMTYQRWLFDEQVPEHAFDGARSRGLTADDFQMAICATPSKVLGRPDTGASHWVARLVSGVNTKGLDYSLYHIRMDEVPDAIVSAKKKKARYNTLIVGPTDRQDAKAMRAGQSRWEGTFEQSEGLVYDNWDINLHLIDPIVIPEWWSRGRALDPGYVDPYAGLWGAIAPWGDVIFYREYYRVGIGLSDNVGNIIAASGNERVACGTREFDSGATDQTYREEFTNEHYQFTVVDGKTFEQPTREAGVTQGELTRMYGLEDAEPASGQHNASAVPLVRAWFEPVPGRPHILVRMGLVKEVLDIYRKPITAAPRAYVFNTLTRFRGEMEGYENKEDKDEPVDKNDHLMTAMKFWFLKDPRPLGQPSDELEFARQRHPRPMGIPDHVGPVKARQHKNRRSFCVVPGIDL